MAAGPGGAGYGGVDLFTVGAAAGHIYIADAFAGQRQGLGVGVADDGVRVDGGQEGHLHAVSQLPVGLVGDQVDRVPKLGRLFCQHRRQRGEGLPGVHHPGGIVGGIQKDGLSLGGQHGAQSFQIDLEIRHIRGHHLEHKARFFGKGLVLREVGSHRQQLSAGYCQRPENGHQLRGRAAAKEEFLGPGGHAIPGVEIVGNSLPGIVITHGGGVAMHQQGVGFLQNFMDSLVDLCRGGDGGVAQRVVVDVFRTDNGSALSAVFKQVPDAGAVGSQRVGVLVYHNIASDW